MSLDNLELEAELLGQIMSSNAPVDDMAERLTPADFAEPLHGRIFEAAIREASLGKPYSPVALKSYFEHDEDIKAVGGVAYLARLTGTLTLSNPYESAKVLCELSRRRRMQSGLRVASDACSDMGIPISEVLEHADEALSDQARETIHQPSGADAIGELLNSYSDKTKGVECRVIPALDELLGPMKPKQLVICAARPGMGKTALALSYSIGAARSGHGVLFISLEMSSTELAARMAADMSFDNGQGVPFSAIRDGTLNDYQIRKVHEAQSRMMGLPFQIVDTGSLNTVRLGMLIRRHARRMAAQGQKLELVVVDYLQLLRPTDKARSAYEAVSEVSRSLKAMAKDCGVAILALAQLSREVEKRPDKRPILSDLRDSGQIEQDADAVLFLSRPEYYMRQEEPAETSPDRLPWEQAMREMQGRIDFILAKRRNGVTGAASGEFHGAYQAVRS